MNKDSLILALDLDDKNRLLNLVEQTHDLVGTYKLGPRVFLREGPSILDEIKQKSPSCKFFLDFKFHDIPSTTLASVLSAFEIGAHFVTVHASVGKETLKLVAELEASVSSKSFFKVLCVTVLSSVEFSDQTQSSVLELADLVYQSGLKSLVCSPHEARLLKSKYPEAFLVTPGIRFKGDSSGDQKRTMTAQSALEAGSSALVLGRSIINSKEPRQRLEQMINS